MSVKGSTGVRWKAAVSVSEMATMCSLSRARFYDLIERGVFLQPVYSLATRRPFYTSEMQEQNLTARQAGIGCNGEFVLFYERRQGDAAKPASRTAAAAGRPAGLMEALRSLGLSVTTAQVEEAVRSCFPNGTGDVPEADVLRAVNRRLRVV